MHFVVFLVMINLSHYESWYRLGVEDIKVLELFVDAVAHLLDRLLNGEDDAGLSQLFVFLLVEGDALGAQRKQASQTSAETGDYFSGMVGAGSIRHLSLIIKKFRNHTPHLNP